MKRITSEEKHALRYAGLMGHEYILTDSTNRVTCEVDDRERAYEEYTQGRHAKLFRQGPRRKFVRIK